MNQNIHRYRPDNSALPSIIFGLLIANGLIFALQNLQPKFMMINFALWPIGSGSPFAPWQLLTYGFLHGDMTHLFFNMFGLWMFGSDVQRLMGPKRFLTFFVVCVVGAGVVQLIVAGAQGGLTPRSAHREACSESCSPWSPSSAAISLKAAIPRRWFS